MIEQLQMVLFPEYFVKKRVSQHAEEYYIGSILDEIYINLVDQITLALLRGKNFGMRMSVAVDRKQPVLPDSLSLRCPKSKTIFTWM